uniref:Cyclic nucleotide-binding domain-containing protein n=1 Tax=Globisporangium ultimum (strain ATCC 200006 / CBS 805.95 / DAOM BR144) TaxID=431595 RepID=K3WZP3_GLOUD
MPKKFSSSGHWTKGLIGEQTTTKLGARFHLRKLFFRQEEFSQDELEFIIQYLVHETTIQEQQWWVALAQHERLEIVSRLKLHHVAKGDEEIIWFSRNETSKDCILLYGNAEAKPIDPSAAVALSFSEGSVVGNLNLTQSVKSHQQNPMNEQQPHTLDVLASSDFASNWRRVKRERQFRSALQHYNKLLLFFLLLTDPLNCDSTPHQNQKLVLFGPADYLLLTSSDVLETISRAADRVERDNWVKAFGLERFAGCIRRRVFEPGVFLAKEDELLGSMYIIMEGECRASIRSDDTSRQPPKKTLAEMQDQLPIASLGPLSCVGDISVILGVPEPTTIQAITTVTALWLSQEDIAKECGDLRDPVIVASIENRVEAEAKYAQADQRLKIERIRERQREKKE